MPMERTLAITFSAMRLTSRRSAPVSARARPILCTKTVPAIPRRPVVRIGVLDCHVVCHDNFVNHDIFVGGHICCHLEVHDIACIVLDDQEGALAALCCLDGLIDLVGGGGGENSSCYRDINLPSADISNT